MWRHEVNKVDLVAVVCWLYIVKLLSLVLLLLLTMLSSSSSVWRHEVNKVDLVVSDPRLLGTPRKAPVTLSFYKSVF